MTTPFSPDIFDLDIRVLPVSTGDVPGPREMPSTVQGCSCGCQMTRGCSNSCATCTCGNTCTGTGQPCAC